MPESSRNQTSRKRKNENPAALDDNAARGPESNAKKPRVSRGKSSKSKGKAPPPPLTEWPEYFQSLFKIYKALNTVLAFCSSRKQLAITFPVVRASVEGLLRHPLELSKVAELKALLPDVINFAYTPSAQLRIHEDSFRQITQKQKAEDADFSLPPGPVDHNVRPAGLNDVDEEEHVLVLDFIDTAKGKNKSTAGSLYAPTPALTPAATKKLVEKRNDRFILAVNELLQATPPEENPVDLLQAAARDHIPMDPNKPKTRELDHREVPDPQHRPAIEEIITEIQEQDWYTDQIAHRSMFEAKQGQNGELSEPVSDNVWTALRSARKITSLYTHQVAAINALSEGQHVIVSTATASGKSVIYQVPLLRFLEADPHAKAIFIYPTKALAQDQKAALEQLLCACPGLQHIKVATYDGDTPPENRTNIREIASVIFTNFDMIHASILPHEDVWRSFLKNMKLVAVDELHYYTGVFGSHVAQVIRRFRRICAAVGNRRVQFVSCSATISNAGRHMSNMFGVTNVVEVTEDGAPSGSKDFLVWTPPLKDPQDPSSGCKSALSEATTLMRFLMLRGVRVILFCKIRKSCEHAMKALRTELTAEGRLDILSKVMSYRGGYSPQDRRRIEQEAFSGNLLGIVATNALELGIDIGVLDAVIMLGFPMGGIASFRQQAGRAGRRARDALVVYIADGLPVDKHYAAHPDELFDKPMNDIVIDLDNKILLESHLQCAAFELPMSVSDEQYFGPLAKEICDSSLMRDDDGWYHTNPKYLPYPSKHISLRGVEEEKYVAVDVTRVGKPGGHPKILEEIEVSRSMFELYEGAVFIHQGVTFLVKEVSHDSKMAKLVRADVNWTTEPRDFTDVDAVQTQRIHEIKGSRLHAYYGRVELITTVFGYFKVRNNAIIESVDLDTPPWERDSTGLWLDIPKATLQLLRTRGINAAEAIHAACHAFLNQFPLAQGLGTECKAAEKEYKAAESGRKRPARLIFYEDGGSSGLAAKAFDHVSPTLHNALDAIETCDCDEGCTNCVTSPGCKEHNLVKNKTGALIILSAILDRPVDVDVLPPPSQVEATDTIVEAPSVGVAAGVQVEKEQ